MSSLRAEDGDASERELLVDDIQRIREVLHISGAAVSSDDEEEDEESEDDEEKEEKREGCRESLLGSTSNSLQHQIATHLSSLNSQTAIHNTGLKAGDIGEQSALNASDENVSSLSENNTQGPPDVLSLQQNAKDNFLPPQSTANISSDKYTLTELQPVNCQPSTSALSATTTITSIPSLTDLNSFTNAPCPSDPCTSFTSTREVEFSDTTWLTEENQFHDPNEVDEHEEEEGLFSEGDDENYKDMETRSKIQQCLTLNRDYQLAILDELERIELALAKNRERQFGLHQMRASKDEGRPEPYTLIKFANPYFKDSGAMGPPDNDDTKMKRQTSQVGGYMAKQKRWNVKEKEQLAEGVKMQNLENKLSPVLQKIQKLELKKNKTQIELQELEDLKAESSRIKSVPKEKLAYDLEGIDWDRVSNTYVPKRTAFQCRLQWCNFGHPDVNQTPWTKDEDKKLLQLAKDPQNTWVTIAQNLQTKRTPIYCYERYQRSLNKDLLKRKWTPEDDKLLLDVVRVVGVGNWQRVANFLEGRQGDQCMHRYTQTLQMVRKGKWTKEEDELLKKGIEKYGTSWNKLSEMVPGRSGPQCRERWVNALDPKIDKGEWTRGQDKKLLESVEKFGQGSWSKIAQAIGNRTDNQCWRRWIVLRKDDFLHYRQNTLRKKRELVANFTGRRQERPSLKPEDLDIPDVPVVKKPRGRVPLPPEVSRERRRLTRAKSREKKRAEKRKAEEEAREKASGEKRQVQHTEKPFPEESVEEGEEGLEGGDEETVEENKNPRKRKAGRNRTRVQQPHHRVLMKNKQLVKRKKVTETREKRQAETTGGGKTVTVSGSLGPFSLLLQAFSIDIPTVLQAIQKRSTTPSTTPPSSGTNVTPTADTTSAVESITPSNQHEVRTEGTTGNQKSQQAQASGDSATSQSFASTEVGARDDTSENQSQADQEKQEKEQVSCEPDSQLLKEKSNESGGDQATKSANTEQTVDLQRSVNGDRMEAGIEPTVATPTSTTASTTNQVPIRRAPAIPPLPPCFTTLRTFRSLLQLRPQLQRIATMLNSTTGCSTAGSQAHEPLASARPAVLSNSQSDRVSSVTCEARDESCDGDVTSRKDSEAVNKSRDNINTSGEDHVVSPGCARDIQPSIGMEEGKEHSASFEDVVKEYRLWTSDTQRAKQSLQITSSDQTVSQRAKALEATPPSTVQDSCGTDDSLSTDFTPLPNEGIQEPENDKNRTEQTTKSSETSTTNTEAVDDCVSVGDNKQTDTTLHEGIDMGSPSPRVSTTVVNNSQGTPATMKTRLYRNSYEYKMLSSRFSSLFLWPALLSKIPVRFTSQIGPVFVQRHPPPLVREKSSTPESTCTRKRKNTKSIEPPTTKRKHPGLAAVRMASSASFTTPAQQFCTVGQGFAIRKEARPVAAEGVMPEGGPSGAKEVVVAASQLVSLSGSAPVKRPYNTRMSKRKALPVKRKYRVIERSSSSSDDDDEDVDDDDDDDDDDSFVINARQARQIQETQTARKTRQTSARKHAKVTKTVDAESTSRTQTMFTAAATDQAGSTNQVASQPVVVILSDSANECQSSLQVCQGDTTVQESGAAANQNLSPTGNSNSKPSPSSSSKRKSRRPEKNRGARWRAMLPRVSSDEGDSQSNDR